jgi:predicted DsbA family dithiol-disulfide isomerase
MAFTIDVISDVVCPWCFIGKRRLDAALAGLARTDPQFSPRVNWHPFELNPDLPAAGVDRKSYLEAKFGGRERAAEIYARVKAAGDTVGIAFDFDRIAVQPNTFDAHRLIGWAQREGHAAGELVERLFTAYFIDGRNLADRAVLADIAGEAGLTRTAARANLDAGSDGNTIRNMEQRARDLGVSGVPFFIFGEKLAVSGAQPVETLLGAIDEARAAA